MHTLRPSVFIPWSNLRISSSKIPDRIQALRLLKYFTGSFFINTFAYGEYGHHARTVHVISNQQGDPSFKLFSTTLLISDKS